MLNNPGLRMIQSPLWSTPLKTECFTPEEYPKLLELMEKMPGSFPDEISKSINNSIQKNDSIKLLFMNYTRENIKYTLTTLITSDNESINFTNAINQNEYEEENE